MLEPEPVKAPAVALVRCNCGHKIQVPAKYEASWRAAESAGKVRCPQCSTLK